MSNPYEDLGLPAGAAMREVEQAYQRLKGLYAADALATYALLPDEQRQQRLQVIEQAFRQIVATHAPHVSDEGAGPASEPFAEPAPDQMAAPGAYLRWLRLRSALTLRELAERTKVSAGKLDAIEQQRFDLLPPPVYLRGFVFEYARCLGHADARHLAELYLQLHPDQDGEL